MLSRPLLGSVERPLLRQTCASSEVIPKMVRCLYLPRRIAYPGCGFWRRPHSDTASNRVPHLAREGETANGRSMIRIAPERSGAAPKSSTLRYNRTACDADAYVWHARLLPSPCEQFSPLSET